MSSGNCQSLAHRRNALRQMQLFLQFFHPMLVALAVKCWSYDSSFAEAAFSTFPQPCRTVVRPKSLAGLFVLFSAFRTHWNVCNDFAIKCAIPRCRCRTVIARPRSQYTHEFPRSVVRCLGLLGRSLHSRLWNRIDSISPVF